MERSGAEVFTSESSGGQSFVAGSMGAESLSVEKSAGPSSSELAGARLLTAREGRALVDVALQQPMPDEKPDCSHLVHQVLNDAGLTYPYATSSAIFAGIPQFRRVRYAQPGDLIVWRGHVGFVVDPRRTTFFSSTDSGVRTDQYTSDYWRHRGFHRFYRYIVTHATLLAAHRLTEEHAVQSTRRDAIASLEAPRAQEKAQDRSGASEPSSEAATAAEASPDDAPLSPANHDLPETILIDTDSGTPTKDDLEQAISELTNASAAALESASREASTSTTTVPIVFVRSWKVEKIKIKGDEGWVEFRVTPSGERNPDGTWKKLRAQKIHCDLRRDQTGWVLVPPRDHLYVNAQPR